MRRTSMIIAATLALSMPSLHSTPETFGFEQSSYSREFRQRRRRRQNQSPMAQKARAIRKKKKKHSKKYNRHFTPRMK